MGTERAPPRLRGPSLGRGLEGQLGRGNRVPWNRHHENRALAGLTLHVDRAAHGVDDLPDDPQSQAKSGVDPGRYRALESLENPSLLLDGNANPPVANAQTGSVLVAGEANFDGLAPTVFHGIGEQVVEDLFD